MAKRSKCKTSSEASSSIEPKIIVILPSFREDTPGKRNLFETIMKRNDSSNSLKRKDSDSSINKTPSEKSPRPTSLFRMGGKLFQDGSSKDVKKPLPERDRVQSLSSSGGGRSNMFTQQGSVNSGEFRLIIGLFQACSL